MEKQLAFAWQSGLFLAVCLVLFVLARWIFHLFTEKITKSNGLDISVELVDKDNFAFYVVYCSYFLGFIAIIGGVMNSEGSGDLMDEIILSFIYGSVGILAFNVITIVLDRLVHRSVFLWKEVMAGNVAIGLLKGGTYVSTGIIIGGVLMTEVDKPVQAALFLLAAVLFASIGLVYYNLVTPFIVRKEIYKGNVAVALSAVGAQIAFAILIYAGFQIEHETWVDSLVSIGIDVLGGMILLPVIRFILDKVFIPRRRSITQELITQEKPNVGLGLFEAAAYIGGAFLFIWCWNL